MMMLLLLFTTVVAYVTDILIGMLTCKAELEFGVACAVFALITVVQWLAVAHMKRLGGGG
jgi:hypothetical protein